MTKLIVVAGIPGSGKTTWSQAMFTETWHYKRVSPDDIRRRKYGSLQKAWENPGHNMTLWPEVERTIEDALRHAVDTVLDATNLVSSLRRPYIDLAHECGTTAHFVLFKNVVQAVARNEERRGQDDYVPVEVMQRMTTDYYNTLAELPQEAWDSITKIESYL